MNLDKLSPRELQNIHGLTLVDILKTTEVLPHTLKELCKSTDMYLRWFLADKYKYMTGKTFYYKVPILTRIFKRLKFYISWRDDKFYRLGFRLDRIMSLEDAFNRLERKRLWREE